MPDDQEKTGKGVRAIARSSGVRVDGQRIADERRRQGLSQEKFAAKCAVSIKILKALEVDADKRVHPETLTKIAQALGFEPRSLTVECPAPTLLSTYEEILTANLAIVSEARKFLCATGTRSRDKTYLGKIEEAIIARPALAHIRILFGTPMSAQTLQHLERLVAIKNSGEERPGPLMFASYENPKNYPAEASVCMNERKVLYVLPSITGAWRYDTAVVFEDKKVIEGWHRWIEEMYRTGDQIETSHDISKLYRNGKPGV